MCKTVDDLTIFVSDNQMNNEYDVFNAFVKTKNLIVPFSDAVNMIHIIRGLLVTDKRILQQTVKIISEKRGS